MKWYVRSRIRCARGSVFVEFLVGLAFFAILIVTLVDFGRFVYQQEHLSRIAFEISRLAAIFPQQQWGTLDTRFEELIDSNQQVQSIFLQPNYSMNAAYDAATDTVLITVQGVLRVFGAIQLPIIARVRGPALTPITPPAPIVGAPLVPLYDVFDSPPTLLGCDGTGQASGLNCNYPFVPLQP